MTWKLIDHSDKSKGYLRLTRDGKRVADFFPFAYGTDPEWVREQAKHITAVLNAADVHSAHDTDFLKQKDATP